MKTIKAHVSTGKRSSPPKQVGDLSVYTPADITPVDVIASRYILGNWFIAHKPLNSHKGIVVSHAQTGFLATTKDRVFNTTREAFDNVLYNVERFERTSTIKFKDYVKEIRTLLPNGKFLVNHLATAEEFDSTGEVTFEYTPNEVTSVKQKLTQPNVFQQLDIIQLILFIC